MLCYDMIAVFVNKQQLQHGIQRQGQNLEKSLYLKRDTAKEVDRRISWKKLDKAWC